jgi:hypothetical protein
MVRKDSSSGDTRFSVASWRVNRVSCFVRIRGVPSLSPNNGRVVAWGGAPGSSRTT